METPMERLPDGVHFCQAPNCDEFATHGIQLSGDQFLVLCDVHGETLVSPPSELNPRPVKFYREEG